MRRKRNKTEVIKWKMKKSELEKELKKYQRAYNILMDYFDDISEEEKPNVDKRLKRLGL